MSVYIYPSKKALLSIMAKVRALTKKARRQGLADLLGRLNSVFRGWCAYFRPRRVESDLPIPLPGIGLPNGCSSGTNGSRGRISIGVS